jgi:hypothetical protein
MDKHVLTLSVEDRRTGMSNCKEDDGNANMYKVDHLDHQAQAGSAGKSRCSFGIRGVANILIVLLKDLLVDGTVVMVAHR